MSATWMFSAGARIVATCHVCGTSYPNEPGSRCGECDRAEELRVVSARAAAFRSMAERGTTFPVRRGPEDVSVFHGRTPEHRTRDPRYWEALDDIDGEAE